MQPMIGPLAAPDTLRPLPYAEMVRAASTARAAATDSAREPVVLPTFAGDGLLPGVDLDSGASLAELMDAGDPH